MESNNVIKIIKILKKNYPDAKCSLNFSSPFTLLVAVMLSAQCTDERVNLTTPSIFAKYNTPQDFATMDIKVLEDLIHPCGFYKTKATHIQETSCILLEKFDGQVPQNMKDLMSLPGVGRKTANVVMLEAFSIPCGIAVDTHAKRLANRIGLSQEKKKKKIEQDLIQIFPKKYWKDINHLFIWHGRNCCTARNPQCDSCSIQKYCKKNI